ncbi:hypothetical protein [Chromohalobacter israelensis]|uniref:hypothetical protein n=1 Tax=Chromohalobacter israelensis TaxID=141390 RepID=UPI00265BCB7D|nr:hypothetical protein [Chromohalobacter salexigens]MDO0945936.1 hypothetical protein [Chromohalobacter salexigens]
MIDMSPERLARAEAAIATLEEAPHAELMKLLTDMVSYVERHEAQLAVAREAAWREANLDIALRYRRKVQALRDGGGHDDEVSPEALYRRVYQAVIDDATRQSLNPPRLLEVPHG